MDKEWYESKTLQLVICDQTIELDTICPDCQGSGLGETKNWARYEDGKNPFECDTCNGEGYVLTENGQAILNFINRYLFPRDKEQDQKN